MIKPYSSEVLNPLYVKEESHRKILLGETENIPSVVISSAAAANAVMLGSGYFNPLSGYMNLAEVLGVAERMQMPSGLLWPTPVVNQLRGNFLPEEIKSARKIKLCDPNIEGNPVIAIQSVDKIETMSEEQIRKVSEQIYGTSSYEHPGVATFIDSGDTLISGPIDVLNYSYFSIEFPDTFKTAVEIRNEIKERGWETVVAFQTRNPMHRSHEYLAKDAVEICDGILIHQVLGALKPGDIPAETRVKAIDALVENYFVPGTVIQAGYPIEMRYAGPREALLHAVFRQNFGCSHLVVGRDHAGVGSYYGPFDAHHIFDTLEEGALKTQPLKIDITFFCKACAGMATGKTCPHDEEARLNISGTRLREMFANGEEVPPEFSRAEVLEVLREYYGGLD